MRSPSTVLTLADVFAEVGGRRAVYRRVGRYPAAGEITRAAVIAAGLRLNTPVRRISIAAVVARQH